MLERAIDHLPSGVVAFDGVAGWVRRIGGWQTSMRRADTGFRWALRSAAGVAAEHPRLRLTDERSAIALIGHTITNPVGRPVLAGPTAVPGMRDAMRLVRYGFG